MCPTSVQEEEGDMEANAGSNGAESDRDEAGIG